MRVFGIICALVLSLASIGPSFADHGGSQVNWRARDTATYVVSTVNLLRTREHRPLVPVLENRFRVDYFGVYQDLHDSDLYYIRLTRHYGSLVGVLAYQLGWPRPRSISRRLTSLGVKPASKSIAADYRDAPKRRLAQFASTVPQ